MLQTWLQHNAGWDPAAREVGIHRHTLKAQVRRAGSLVRLDLNTFEAKAELWAMFEAAGGSGGSRLPGSGVAAVLHSDAPSGPRG